jgi:short-subunit dehydrogenase
MSKIFITGTNRGLGLEFVKQFLNRGDQVTATCRNPKDASELNKLQDNQNLQIFSLDVGDHSAVQKLQQQLVDQPIDILLTTLGFGEAVN